MRCSEAERRVIAEIEEKRPALADALHTQESIFIPA